MKYGFVYIWTNILNEKKYIGSHYGNINDGYIGSGVYFKKAYIKHKEYFKRNILYIGHNYKEKELFFLKKYDAANNDSFYNLKNEAIGGWSHISKQNIIDRNKKISETKKGIYPDYLNYDKTGKNNPMFGKSHSEETKQKIKNKALQRDNHYSKKIIELTENKIYNSVKECADYYNINQSTMSVLIRGELIKRGTCKNKIFKYL